MPTADDFDIADCAALEFEKLPDDELLRQFTATAWNLECANAGITLRMAAIMLEKTKDELIAVARGLGSEDFVEMLDRLHDQRQRFIDLAALLDAATARLLVAGSAITAAGGGRPVGFAAGLGPIL